MSYLDVGYSVFLTKESTDTPREQMEVDTSFAINKMIGTKIGSGITTAASGRIKINWDEGSITINDGDNDVVLIGYQKDGF